MKRKIKIGLILISIIGFSFYCSNNFLTTGMISGKYTFKNFNSESCLADSPNSSDTLVLFENGTFTSNFLGKGTYKLKHSYKGTSIDLTYDYEFGKAGYKTKLKREYFSDPRIIINEDLNQYMERIEK